MLYTTLISTPVFLKVHSCFANGSLLLFKIMCKVCILVIVSLLHVNSVLIKWANTLL